MSNCIYCKLGQRVQFKNNEGGWDIGTIISVFAPVAMSEYTLVQPYHGGPPIFVKEFEVRNDEHEEPTR